MILKINDRFRNRKVLFFNQFSLNLVYNSNASQFRFQFYFDPTNPEHKELACVTHFHEVTLEEDGEMLLKGVITSQNFRVSSVKELCSFSGYSLPGVLSDCQIPPSIYPLQSDGLSLQQIANKLIQPFRRNYGLEMVVDPAVQSRMNQPFETSTANETETIIDYLSGIAKQKNIIISHDEKGRLLFTEAKTDIDPILDFDLTKEQSIPGTQFSMNYDGQGMHSHITVQKQASIDGGNAGEETIRNPYVIGSVYRPAVKSQTSGDDNQTFSAAQRALSNELKNVTLEIQTDRWIVDGKILRPNNIITIKAPKLYIYRKERFFIESINFEGDETQTIATLNCVLPEVYNGKTPQSIFRKINLHANDVEE
jgi:prophage tail gpP-like protein